MSVITGRRKEATAAVRLKKGSGLITVNKKVWMTILAGTLPR